MKVKHFSYIITMYNYKLMQWERIGICCFCFEQGAFFCGKGLDKMKFAPIIRQTDRQTDRQTG